MSLFPKNVLATRSPVNLEPNKSGSVMSNTSPVESHPHSSWGTFTRMEDRAGRVCDGANSLSILAGLIPIKHPAVRGTCSSLRGCLLRLEGLIYAA